MVFIFFVGGGEASGRWDGSSGRARWVWIEREGGVYLAGGAHKGGVRGRGRIVRLAGDGVYRGRAGRRQGAGRGAGKRPVHRSPMT